jgi:hypothetical protein
MVPQEQRWIENAKKAFYESDTAFVNGVAADNAFPALCKAIDVCATLRLSLQSPASPWVPPSHQNNKKKFISFLQSEIPDADANGLDITLLDSRTNQPVVYNFGGIVYAIRCMVHENENLNAAESPDYHVILDWCMARYGLFGTVKDGRLTCNAQLVWWRVREVVSKFILGLEFLLAIEGDGPAWIGDSQLQSIHPGDGMHQVVRAATK